LYTTHFGAPMAVVVGGYVTVMLVLEARLGA